MNFHKQNAALFEYRLLGQDTTWRPSYTNTVNLYALNPGNYVLEARPILTGSSPEAAKVIPFTILSPIWKRWWFVLGTLGLVLGLMGLAFWWRIRQVEIRERVKRLQLQREGLLEQRALASAMNPHFIFNSLNSVQQLFVKHKDLEAIRYVGNLATLMRNNLDHVSQRKIPLTEEVDQLEQYLSLEQHRFKDDLTYSINCAPGLLETNPLLPALLVQPFVENALVHGLAQKKGKKEVVVQFGSSAEGITISVEDNGIGLEEAQKRSKKNQHVSRGMNLAKRRLQLFDPRNTIQVQTQTNEQGEVTGTLVEMVLYATG